MTNFEIHSESSETAIFKNGRDTYK